MTAFFRNIGAVGDDQMMMASNVTDHGFDVGAEFDVPQTGVRLRLARDDDPSVTVWLSDPQDTVDAQRESTPLYNHNIVIAGPTAGTLQADTLYRAYFVIGGKYNPARYGTYRTFPVTGSPGSYKLVWISCTKRGALDRWALGRAIAAEGIHLGIHLGDRGYDDVAAQVSHDLQATRRYPRKWRRKGDVQFLNRRSAWAYELGDHCAARDSATTESNGGVDNTVMGQVRAVIAESEPHYPFQIANTMVQVINIARSRIILMDTMSEAKPSTGKRISDTQMTFVQNQLIAARDDGINLVHLGNPTEWAGPASGSDRWASATYQAQRATLAEFIRDTGCPLVHHVNGDPHYSNFGDGSDQQFASGGGDVYFQTVASSGYIDPLTVGTDGGTWLGRRTRRNLRAGYTVTRMEDTTDNKTRMVMQLKGQAISQDDPVVTHEQVATDDAITTIGFLNATSTVAAANAIPIRKIWQGLIVPPDVSTGFVVTYTWTVRSGASVIASGTAGVRANCQNYTLDLSAYAVAGRTVTLSAQTNGAALGTSVLTFI